MGAGVIVFSKFCECSGSSECCNRKSLALRHLAPGGLNT